MRNASYPNISQNKASWPHRDNVTTEGSYTPSFNIIQRWYRPTRSTELAAHASFTSRDGYGKTRLFSNTAFLLSAILVFSIILGLFLSNPHPLYLESIEIAIACICLLLNRIDRISVASMVAHKAAMVATLEHRLAEQGEELESGIDQILQTHVSAANGNLNARVSLAQNHTLWHVARALNSLLVHHQRVSISERELQRIEHAVTSTVRIIHRSTQQRQQAHIPFTHTAIDPLITAIQGKTFAFTRPLRQQNNSLSADPISAHTVGGPISSRHTPP